MSEIKRTKSSKNKRKPDFPDEIADNQRNCKRKKSGRKKPLLNKCSIATESKQRQNSRNSKQIDGVVQLNQTLSESIQNREQINAQKEQKEPGKNNNAIPEVNEIEQHQNFNGKVKTRAQFKRQQLIKAIQTDSDDIENVQNETVHNTQKNDQIENDGIKLQTSDNNLTQNSIQDSESEEDEDDEVTSSNSSDSSSSEEGEIDNDESGQSSEGDDEVTFNDQDLRAKIKNDPHYRKIMDEMLQEKIQKDKSRIKKRRKKRGKNSENLYVSPENAQSRTPIMNRRICITIL